ncbi:MAG: response regulator [Magnetococcales bacterium]|nr:response regulator [Magnetococcales bacterium]MBF0115912.1 response regulator [Magnetococcales bacterium]
MQEDWPSHQQQDPLHWVAFIQAQLRQMHALTPSTVMQTHLQHLQMASDTLLSLLTPAGVEQSVRQAEFTPRATGQGSPLRLLLVEDNPFTQKLMSRLLTMRAQHIAVAGQGEEALKLLQEATVRGEPFNMVLMDIRMPGMDGFEATHAIRQWEAESARPRVPIIAVTVLNDEADRQRAKQVGMDGFHCKPVQANQLFAEIEQLLPAPAVSEVERALDDTECALDIGLNMESLLKTVEDDWGLLGEIVDLYRTDAPKQLQRIQDGIQRQDPDLVREAAHSLKGASGAFGKSTLSFALAYQLEQAGRNRDLGQAHELLQQLRHSIQLMEQALGAELRKHSSL